MTLGSELGTGLGAFAQQFIGTQNTLKQQQLDQQQKDAEYNLKLRQQAATEAYNQSQLAQGQQTLDQQAARDAATIAKTGGDKRQTDFQNVLAPTYNGELQSLGDAIKSYGPSAGANFNPAVYDHAVTRMKQLKKLMSAVSLTTASGEGYDDARAALLNFVGAQDEAGNVHPAPSTTTPGGQSAPTPAAQPVPQIDMRFDPAARRDAMVNGDPAPQAPPAAVMGNPISPRPETGIPVSTSPSPVTSDLGSYTHIQDVPPSTLLTADDAALVARFGPGSDQYAQIARSTYKAAQVKAQQDAAEARLTNWKAQYGELSKNPDLTPSQRTAMLNVSTLLSLPSLDEGQRADLTASMAALDPVVYTPSHWAAIVGRDKDSEIVSMYDWYKQKAPEVVAGFDIAPARARLLAAVDKTAADTAQVQANTLETNTLLPGKVQAQTDTSLSTQANTEQTIQTTELQRVLKGETKLGDVKDPLTLQALADDPAALDALGITRAAVIQRLGEVQVSINQGISQGAANLGKTQADTVATGASTHKTNVDANKVIFDQGTATLGQLAGTGATIYQLQHDGSNTWAHLKQQLHLSDAELAAVFQQARWEADQKAKGVVLDNTYKNSQILTQGATRAGIIASTNDTISTTRAREARLQPELNLLNQQIRNAELQGQDTASLIARRNALLPYDVQQAQVNIASTKASTQKTLTLLPIEAAKGWADIGDLQSQVHTRNVRLNLDVQAQRGKLDLTAATTAHLTAQTLYERAKNPNDKLYNPAIAATKPGDPNAALYKQIDQYVTASKTASGMVTTFQRQIDAITEKYKTALGTTDLSRITPADKTALTDLTSKRDAQVTIATERQKKADALLLGSPPPAPGTSGAGTTGSGNGRVMTAPAGFRAQTDGVAQKVGVNPQHLYAFLGAESSFGTKTDNYKGMDYVGPGQIGAAAQADVNRTYGLNLDRNNPAQNMEIAARYYKMLASKYGNDPQKIYAAYNMGSGNFDTYLKQNGGKIVMNTLPAETQTGLGNLQASLRGYAKDKPAAGQTAINPPPVTTAPPKTAGTALPTGTPTPASFKPNPALEDQFRTAIQNKDPNGTPAYADALVKAGYSQAQVLALGKKFQAGK